MTTIRFLADHDLNEHIVEGVRRREPAIEFLRVRDFRLQMQSDSEILEFANQERFVLVSHDVNTMTSAAALRLEESKSLCGLLMIPQSLATGSAIDSLVLIWMVTEMEDWVDKVVFLPL